MVDNIEILHSVHGILSRAQNNLTAMQNFSMLLAKYRN